MSAINDGGPAFPADALTKIENGVYERVRLASPGMSLRDWFAGHSLAGLLASRIAAERGHTCEDVAEMAFKNADAMLAERAKGGKQ